MSQMLKEYVEWVKGTLVCKKCHLYPQHLVNANFGTGQKSLPQAGYLGTEYEAMPLNQRVLVLGKNPAKGKQDNTPVDAEYYGCLHTIQDVASLKQVMPLLQAMHSRWDPLNALDLPNTVGLKPSQIAYANQILCRDTQGAISKIEMYDRMHIAQIYDNCFDARIKTLIEILKPQYIVALGKKQQGIGIGSWPLKLQRSLTFEPSHTDIHVLHVTFPYPNGRVGEAHGDLISLRNGLGILLPKQ